MTPGQALDQLPLLIEKIQELESIVLTLKPNQLPTWINLPSACKLKGIPFGTVKTNPDKMPNGGWPEGMNGKVRLFRRETVLEWLDVTDTNQSEYLARCRDRRTKKSA
jgi:hypothetical protein